MTTRSGPEPRNATRASSIIRKRPLSSSIGSRRSGPSESNSTGTPGPLAAVAGRAAQRGHEPEVVEDHRPDVEDERLRRVEGLLDHRDELVDLDPGDGRVAGDEPIDDLRLQDDVGQALGRPVVHRPGDLAAEVLLGGEHDPRHAGRFVAVRAPGRRRTRRPGALSARVRAPALRRRRGRRRGRPRSRPSASRKRCEHLRLPSRTSTWAAIRAARRVSSRSWRVELGDIAGSGAVAAADGGQLIGGRLRASPRGGPASARACSTSSSISASSRSRRLEARGRPRARTSAGDAGAAGGAVSTDSRHRLAGRSGRVDQSSGIRIQPWRMAYTTAWVRSFTRQLAEDADMWFLTVCSLIDSA